MGTREGLNTNLMALPTSPKCIILSVSEVFKFFLKYMYIYFFTAEKLYQQEEINQQQWKTTIIKQKHSPENIKKKQGESQISPVVFSDFSNSAGLHQFTLISFFFFFLFFNSFFFLLCAHVQAVQPITHNHFPPSQLFVLRLLPSSCEYKA